MRYSQAEKREIIHLVEHSNLSIRKTLTELDVPRSSFYRWYLKYQKDGYGGLADKKPRAKRIWNRIPEEVKEQVVDLALSHPEKTLEKGAIPVFGIKEKNNKNWVYILDLSSGMLKILIMITDTFLLPEGGIYIIDEYENSLGINTINFLPTFLYELDKDYQFIVTSHHPYIINKISVRNWYIFHRKGQKVDITFGQELEEKYGKSSQSAFIKLINDPLFCKGIE